ncbi:MAG TPA: biotin--[acetyl-CoA-carboxylase] ligase, partial [Streptosporangiaceae bacterium]|nr:biotin--[acetyl-CoA-carboxylase] ligase [Streptosporangiaceae bacterium]
MPTCGQARAADTGREPLDAAAVRAAVLRPDGLWRAVEVTEVTGSTNADLLARAAVGAPEGTVLAAEQQNAGRGR